MDVGVDPVIENTNVDHKEGSTQNEKDNAKLANFANTVKSTENELTISTVENNIEMVDNSNLSDITNNAEADLNNKKESEVVPSICKRRHSETDVDDTAVVLKKTKIKEKNDTENVCESTTEAKTDIDEKNDEIQNSKENGGEKENENSVNTVDSTSDGEPKVEKEIQDEADDLLQRLDAIDSTSLRKPDLKLNEIVNEDLEKDDLLKRLEEAENGIESSSVVVNSSIEVKRDEDEKIDLIESNDIEMLEELTDNQNNVDVAEPLSSTTNDDGESINSKEINKIEKELIDELDLDTPEHVAIELQEADKIDNLDELKEASSEADTLKTENITESNDIIIDEISSTEELLPKIESKSTEKIKLDSENEKPNEAMKIKEINKEADSTEIVIKEIDPLVSVTNSEIVESLEKQKTEKLPANGIDKDEELEESSNNFENEKKTEEPMESETIVDLDLVENKRNNETETKDAELPIMEQDEETKEKIMTSNDEIKLVTVVTEQVTVIQILEDGQGSSEKSIICVKQTEEIIETKTDMEVETAVELLEVTSEKEEEVTEKETLDVINDKEQPTLSAEKEVLDFSVENEKLTCSLPPKEVLDVISENKDLDSSVTVKEVLVVRSEENEPSGSVAEKTVLDVISEKLDPTPTVECPAVSDVQKVHDTSEFIQDSEKMSIDVSKKFEETASIEMADSITEVEEGEDYEPKDDKKVELISNVDLVSSGSVNEEDIPDSKESIENIESTDSSKSADENITVLDTVVKPEKSEIAISDVLEIESMEVDSTPTESNIKNIDSPKLDDIAIFEPREIIKSPIQEAMVETIEEPSSSDVKLVASEEILSIEIPITSVSSSSSITTTVESTISLSSPSSSTSPPPSNMSVTSTKPVNGIEKEKETDISLLTENEAKDLHTQSTAEVMDIDDDMSSNNEHEQQTADTTKNDEEISPNSDSTASITSASEEALLKFSKETNLSDENKSQNHSNVSMNKVDQPKVAKEKMFANVLLMNNGSSTPNSNNTSVSGSNMFNSTPIQNNFEISSENVSKISSGGNTDAKVINDVHMADTTDDDVDSHLGGKSDAMNTENTTEENDQQSSSDGITNFAKSIIKLNGLSPSSQSESEEISKSIDSKHDLKDDLSHKLPFDPINGINLDLSNETSEESLYEISVWYEENDMKFFSIEKMGCSKKYGGRMTPTSSCDLTGNESSSGKRSSNCSVGSLGPFSLPGTRLSAVSSSSSTESSQKTECKFAIPALPQKSKHTIKGITMLCNFMIEHFTKFKLSLNPLNVTTTSNDKSMFGSSVTPTKRGRPAETTKKMLIKEGVDYSVDDDKSPEVLVSHKRKSGDVSSDNLADDEGIQSAKKKAKNSTKVTIEKTGKFLIPPAEPTGDITKVGISVLARWVDKKYYAGKVIEAKPGQKFVVKFEDGAHKTLSHDLIVFGSDEDVLPLLHQEIHAMVDDEEYEAGLVTSYEIENGSVYYIVETDSKRVRITNCGIYLTDEQAKIIQNISKDATLTDGDSSFEGDGKTGSAKRPHRNVTPKVETSLGGGRRGKKSEKHTAEGEAGFSGGITVSTGKRGRPARIKRPQPQSESSDVSDPLDIDSAPNSPDSALEAVDGVQPELQKTPKESQINKMCIMAEYLGSEKSDKNKNLEDILGPIPTNKNLFRNKHFILTCTITMKSPRASSVKKEEFEDMKNKYRKFTALPFIKEHIRKQIEEGGGKIYNHFEDIPKNKYKQCKLIAPNPCVTAKYVQCLAAEIPAISHEWIIESCRNSTLADTKLYALPSGWSIIEERYIKWAVGRSSDQRTNANPLSNQIVLMASQNKEFSEFWTRVCKLAGSTIRIIKSASDITQGQNGYMLTDEEFPQDIKSKAEHFGIPIVSTVWVVQSLILGKSCKPDAHEKLTQIYQDDDY